MTAQVAGEVAELLQRAGRRRQARTIGYPPALTAAELAALETNAGTR